MRTGDSRGNRGTGEEDVGQFEPIAHTPNVQVSGLEIGVQDFRLCKLLGLIIRGDWGQDRGDKRGTEHFRDAQLHTFK